MPSIVVLTGAGISAESGIKTFRDQGGLWEDHAIEDVATPEAFVRNPELVHRFYNLRRAHLLSPEIQPNAAHQALAELEKNWPGELLIVTQNIDDLHERAGTRKILHMHGELLKARCLIKGSVLEWREPLTRETACPCCGGKEALRPHIVWFGEMPFEMDRILKALTACDLFVAIGTSGQVYPAADFVSYAPAGARTVEINATGTAVSRNFEQTLTGKAGAVVPAFVERLLSQGI